MSTAETLSPGTKALFLTVRGHRIPVVILSVKYNGHLEVKVTGRKYGPQGYHAGDTFVTSSNWLVLR